MIVIPAEAGIQGYQSVWIPHQVRNDSPSNYKRQSISFSNQKPGLTTKYRKSKGGITAQKSRILGIFL